MKELEILRGLRDARRGFPYSSQGSSYARENYYVGYYVAKRSRLDALELVRWIMSQRKRRKTVLFDVEFIDI